jgi:hypothetical protein
METTTESTLDQLTYTALDDATIYKVTSQTNYTKEQAIQKLQIFQGDYMKVLKDYMGIIEKKEAPIKSVQQEIYKQIRFKLNREGN